MRRLAASHILVAFSGATGAGASVTRSEKEAQALAAKMNSELAGGASFEALAREHSDDASSAARGGTIGVFLEDAVDPAFAEAVASVDEGAIAGPFRTPYGFHLARRDVIDLARGRHILVSFQGARNSSETHNRAHARRMVDMLETRLQRGAEFEKLAAEFSNDTTAQHGGDLGLVGDGQLLPVLEQAVDKLKPGQRTVVESAYGWHLVERTE